MSIYDLIADNYSEIFPPDNNRLEFISSIYPSGTARILDTGCATGDIAIELAKSGHDVTGIDLNDKMISIAQNKIKNLQYNINFHVMNMLYIGELGSFNLILCFGNTLPHLQSETEVDAFFQAAYACLMDNGHFIFQILNYDKILSRGNIEFQIIENDSFIFRRDYTFPGNGLILFKIEYEDKKTGRIYTDSTNLLPLNRGKLLSLLKKTGFKNFQIYSDYKRTKSDLQEFASIYVADKS